MYIMPGSLRALVVGFATPPSRLAGDPVTMR
jgi:hypothetical protein